MMACLFLSVRGFSFTSLIYCSLPVFEFFASRFLLKRSFMILSLLLYSEIKSWMFIFNRVLNYRPVFSLPLVPPYAAAEFADASFVRVSNIFLPISFVLSFVLSSVYRRQNTNNF